jgi:hypothetical protein
MRFGLIWPDGSLTDIQPNPPEARPTARVVEVHSLPRERGPYRYDEAGKAAVAAPELRPRSLEDARTMLLARGGQAPQWAKDLVTKAANEIA